MLAPWHFSGGPRHLVVYPLQNMSKAVDSSPTEVQFSRFVRPLVTTLILYLSMVEHTVVVDVWLALNYATRALRKVNTISNLGIYRDMYRHKTPPKHYLPRGHDMENGTKCRPHDIPASIQMWPLLYRYQGELLVSLAHRLLYVSLHCGYFRHIPRKIHSRQFGHMNLETTIGF